jgi:peptidoglycan/LPS O-acetylase OafA/YrhL
MKTIRILQCGRGIAATAVVLHHAAQNTELRVEAVPRLLAEGLDYGFLGVDFFFVLSGFLILYAHASDDRSPAAAAGYIGKRMTRIYAPYLPIGLAMTVWYSAAGLPFSPLTSLTLLPAGAPALSVAWTLTHELLFYTLFAASYFTRHFAVLIAAWASLIVGATVLWGGEVGSGHSGFAQAWLLVLLSPLNLEFIFGMIAALAVMRLPARWWPVAFLIGAAGAVAFFVLLSGEALSATTRVWFGLSMAFVLAAVVWREKCGSMATPAWLMVLGNASYSIYLVHEPLVALGARAIGHLGALASWPLALAACAGTGIAAGLLYHIFVEIPALSTLRRHIRQRTWPNAGEADSALAQSSSRLR